MRSESQIIAGLALDSLIEFSHGQSRFAVTRFGGNFGKPRAHRDGGQSPECGLRLDSHRIPWPRRILVQYFRLRYPADGPLP